MTQTPGLPKHRFYLADFLAYVLLGGLLLAQLRIIHACLLRFVFGGVRLLRVLLALW